MIIKIKGKCQYEGCTEKATHLACGRNRKKGHDEPKCYCEVHADQVSEEDRPEYTAYCPNCGCTFGIN